MNKQPLIALEIHDASLWEPSRVMSMIDTMERWGYNALVLHQNDLLDVCTQLFLSANYGVADLRLKKVRNNTAWLNTLAERLAKFDAKLFLEIKEPSFQDYVLEQYPDLLGKDGKPNPANTEWFRFCEDKVRDLLARVPGIAGLIVTISSPESRVSLPDYLATTGGSMDVGHWFDEMISAFLEPLEEREKELFIRDFSYTTDMQSEVLGAVERKEGKVGASVKITAHDYFPGFPENPVARTVSENLVLEFEGFGEHMGWGVIPNCRVEEFRKRMVGYREMNADGFLMRVSWEAITGVNALDALSAVNVYALPRLINEDIDAERLIADWLQQEFEISGELAKRATTLLLESWRIPAAAYWNDQVFPRHSCLPSTWQEGWMSMNTSGMGSREADLVIHSDDPRLSDQAQNALFKEKEAATELAHKLAEDALQLRKELPPRLTELFETFDHLPLFAKQFELAIKATFFAARGKSDEIELLSSINLQLLEYADFLESKFAKNLQLPHHCKLLLDADQVRLFASSLPVCEI